MNEILPGVTREMLNPAYWLDQITDWSAYSPETTNEWYAQSGRLYKLSPANALKFVPPVRPARNLYDSLGNEIDERRWDEIVTLTHLHLYQPAPGFAIRLTDVRRWPTLTQAFRTVSDREFDQFQDTTLHTLDPVFIIGETADGQWLYVFASTYRGFVAKQDIATSTWDVFSQLQAATPFTVVTAIHTRTQPQPYDLTVSAQPVEYAAVLPIFAAVATIADIQTTFPTGATRSMDHRVMPLGRQSDIGHTCVGLPIRSKTGDLQIRPAYIPSSDVHDGWLPCTRETIVRQAFSLLYERYGWGGRLGVHDCSSFIMDIYRTVGVQMPRDTDDQEAALPVKVQFEDNATDVERYALLSGLQPGDPLYMPGHTMLYLGSVGNSHYVIHDFAGYVVDDEEIPINQIMVSTLDIYTSAGKTYLQSLTSGGAAILH